MSPLIEQSGVTLPRDAMLQCFAHHEAEAEADAPGSLYSALLSEAYRRLSPEWGVQPVERRLTRWAPLSPAGRRSETARLRWPIRKASTSWHPFQRGPKEFTGSNERLGVVFDAIYTAKDIGSYKPDPRDFRYAIDYLAAEGVEPGTILHTAQSLFHDHNPARAAGLATAWIDRRPVEGGWGATLPQPDARYDFRLTSLDEMVSAHRAETTA